MRERDRQFKRVQPERLGVGALKAIDPRRCTNGAIAAFAYREPSMGASSIS